MNKITNQITTSNEKTNFLLYTSPNGDIKVDVLVQEETIWMPQKKIAELFGVKVPAISKHLKNIFKEAELIENSVVSILETTANDGKSYQIKFFNLDVIIAVGYRVNSKRATQFRIWATERLKEYIIKGFTMDDERLKDPSKHFGKDYFDEVVERIRDIRTSERRFYQKVTDIYATSVDYDPKSELTQSFFATVQNKMHFGIHGKTATEVISERADSNKPNMGITCISKDKIRKKDIFIAKNYLKENEMQELNLIVDQYLSFAELQARNFKSMTMKDWILKLDDFLKFNEKEILEHKGKISKKLAQEKAEKEFVIFNQERLNSYESDFDMMVKKFEEKRNQKIHNKL